MKRIRALEIYKEDEANLVIANCDAIVRRGYIQDPADLYPEIGHEKHTSFTRTPIPLLFLVLLYERTVIFLPPMRQGEMEERWGLPLEALVKLIRAGVVQPLIGDPVDYTDAHFEQIMETRPPSVWARGLSLLERLGMGDTLKEADCPLPIEAMASLPSIRRKYETYFPSLTGDELTKRIKREILTNYADLWIFGEGQLADSFRLLSSPQQMVDRLKTANEVRTFPVLFGMGGTAHYDRQFLIEEAQSLQSLGTIGSPNKPAKAIPSSLGLLLKGIGINLADITAETIIDFHASGQGQHLRKAMHHFEHQLKDAGSGEGGLSTPSELLEKTRSLEQIIVKATRELSSPSFIRKATRTRKSLDLVLRAGSPALGGWLGHMLGASILEGIGGGAVLQQLVIESMRDQIIDAAMVARFNPGLANLWRIVEARHA